MRPQPPADLLDTRYDPDKARVSFMPAADLTEWAVATFIAEGAPLVNDDHAHLRYASVGMLWTNVTNTRAGRRIVGHAEFGKNIGGVSAGKWGKARAIQQVEDWFGNVPDFLLTFDADYAGKCSDDEFCALVEHELYHCGQERDEFGAPRFSSQSGMPVFGMRGHDVEEFIGVVRRYGADASRVRELVEAASRPPEVASVSIAAACGNCVMPRLVR